MLEDEFLEKIRQHHIPHYIIDRHRFSYVNPNMVNLLDRPFLSFIKSFGQSRRLVKAYLNEIKEGDKVLQLAHVYGNLINKIIAKIGIKGSLDIIDVVPYQLERASQKLKKYTNVDMWLQDATTPLHREYNVVGAYFLLHEVPDAIKKQIIENCLRQIDDFNTKIVFIDYHEPHFLNPVGRIYSLINGFLKPFANSIWEKEIKDFTNKSFKYNWEKTTFFGGIFQKVVVTAKSITNPTAQT